MYNEITANKRKTALLIVIFIGLIIAVGWAFTYTLNYDPSFLVFAVILSIGMSLIGYYAGDKVALASSGAHQITKEDNPYVYRMVENLAITSGMPMPKVHIIDDPALNAFATGRDPEHASIAVTTGIISALENEELEGVLAHELSHIKNFDIRVMTVVVVLAGIVVLLGDWFLRAQIFGGGRRRDNNQAAGILLIIGLLIAILAPLFAQLIKLAISRKREFLADASGSLLTRYPEGLARALEKISTSPHTLKRASNATAHLFISNPFTKGGKKQFFAKMFSTHPPIEERIAALRKMA